MIESTEEPTVVGQPRARRDAAASTGLRAQYRDALATHRADETLDAELLMSTHVAVVVKARVERTTPCAATEEVALVIPRRCCEGDLPTVAALVAAARRHAAAMWSAQRSDAHRHLDGEARLAAIRLCTSNGLVTLLERLQPSPVGWSGAQ